MSVGGLFLIASTALFFITAIDVVWLKSANMQTLFGLCFLALGLLLSGVPVLVWRRPPP